MKLRIERIGPRLETMWGVLMVEGVDTYYTGELASNRIPPGDYLLKRDHTGRHRWWRMYGHAVNDGVPGHEHVEFHPMNHPRVESQACIGLGRMLGFIRPKGHGVNVEQALYDSVPAFHTLLSRLGEEDHELTIVEPA